MKSRIWVASELFYPVQTSTGYIMTEIVNELSKDHSVHVICGPAEYGKKGVIEKNNGLSENITLHRVSSYGLNKDKVLSRILRIVLVSFSITWKLLTKAKRQEKVFIVTNPPLLVLMVALIGRIKKYDIRILVHDVFPDNLIAAGLMKKKNLGYRVLEVLFRKAYCSAHQVLVLGRDMRQLFLNKGVDASNISITENWGDEKTIVPMPKNYTDGISIQFAGNMGRVQGLQEFVQVYKEAGCKQVSVELIGDGAVKDSLQAYKETWGLQMLRIKPPFSRADQCRVLNDCDIALVCLAKGMYGLGVPSKVYNILAAGKPILYVGHPQSEIALMINELDLGWQFDDFNDKLLHFFKELDQTLPYDTLALKGKNARSAAEKYYSKEALLFKYKQAIIK